MALHCALAHGAAWAGLGAALTDRFSIVAPDLPGHGRGTPWPDHEGDYLAAALKVGAAAVAEAEGPVDLIGHSFGGVVALALALADPSRLRSLTLIEPVLFAAAPSGSDTTNAEPGEPFGRLFLGGDRDGAARYFHERWGAGTPWEAIPEARRARLASMIHVVVAQHPAVSLDSGGILAPGRLDSFAVPVLILNGTESPSVVSAICQEIARRLPNVQRVTLAGVGHMAPITHSRLVADAIRQHVAIC